MKIAQARCYNDVFSVHQMARFTIFFVVVFFVSFYIWSYHAELDEIVRGEGRVIPSGQTQMVQNLEGGIIDEIFVKSGDVVEKGEILLRIDDTGVYSSYEEQNAKYLAIEARIARLVAERDDIEPKFKLGVTADTGEFIENEMNLFHARKKENAATVELLTNQISRKNDEIDELKRASKKVYEGIDLIEEELKMTIPLANKNIVPQVDVLSLKRQINEMKRELDTLDFEMVKAEGAKKEISEKLEGYFHKFKREIIEELTELRKNRSQISATIKASVDRVQRTTVRSPVRGTVKQVLVNTLGGVVKPGMDLIEIVPLEANLVVEAELRPQDIAFIRPNQKVNVKISAYDFAIYGGLEASLEKISADSIENDDGERMYKVQVRTQKNYLGTLQKPLPIMPGMVAEIDIKTGKKSVLDYLAKPILGVSSKALQER